jgi:hypothetical protein
MPKRCHSINVVSLLCREDVQPDSRNDALATPLAMAAERGHERVVIIIPGVDIHSRAIKEKRTILSNPIAAARASGVQPFYCLTTPILRPIQLTKRAVHRSLAPPQWDLKGYGVASASLRESG